MNVLGVKDIARILKLSETTIYRMAESGELPARKIRGRWSIEEAELTRWYFDRPAPEPAQDGSVRAKVLQFRRAS